MKLAILIASRNRPDLVENLAAQLAQTSIDHDIYVVECGSDPDKLSPHTTIWYPDPEFKGKCFGHDLALRQARSSGHYDYYWVLMNDLVFEPGVDVAKTLIDTLERESRMAILSPTCKDGLYPGSDRRPQGGWRPVTTVDYLGFMMRGAAVEEVGGLNPAFQYCWGAIHELTYKLYQRGWFVAYSDDVDYEHLGGSTYGAAGTNTITREEYQVRARRFAYDYFIEHYGPDWERAFIGATEGHSIEIDTFSEHKALWAEAFTPDELAERATVKTPDEGHALAAREAEGLVRLHLGCGTDYREGWVNVDAATDLRVDLRAEVHALLGVDDASVDVIEAAHLFEHLPLFEAQAALAEWDRVLKPGGELLLELPDLDACIRLLGKHFDDHGIDLALTGLYGWPPDVEAHGTPMLHKWGWTRAALSDALRKAGFDSIEFGPITQTWRPAARIGRDMRVRACKPAPVTGGPSGPERTMTNKKSFPLSTDATTRVLAWPDYSDPAELDILFERFGSVLAGREDACLCLRHDAAIDVSDTEAAAALTAAHKRVLGEETLLSILLVNDPLTGDDWRNLGDAVDCIALLPSSSESPRAQCLTRTRARTVSTAEQLRARTESQAGTAAYTEEVLDTVDWRLVEQIAELNPWTYPATLGNLQVQPGKGTEHTPEVLEELTARIARLVFETTEVDFKGRSVLELGCDCGYWSARCAELGATSLVGVDASERKLRQAELYYSRNSFLPAEKRTFLHGSTDDVATWDRLERLGSYDTTLCIGLLEHARDPNELLRRAAELTRETLIVVTGLAATDPLTETLVPMGYEATVEVDVGAGLTVWVARRMKSTATLRAAV
jgi:SAM-dependent methyltransferase